MTDMTIVEVNGVKLEVDMRTAKRIETLRVGTRVKVLRKPSYGEPQVHSGVVVGFEPFTNLPSILVAYIKKEDYKSAKIETVAINEKTKDVEIVASVDDILFDREDALKSFDSQILEARAKLDGLIEQREYFQRNFSAYWAPVEKPVAGTIV